MLFSFFFAHWSTWTSPCIWNDPVQFSPTGGGGGGGAFAIQPGSATDRGGGCNGGTEIRGYSFECPGLMTSMLIHILICIGGVFWTPPPNSAHIENVQRFRVALWDTVSDVVSSGCILEIFARLVHHPGNCRILQKHILRVLHTTYYFYVTISMRAVCSMAFQKRPNSFWGQK